MYMKLYGPPKEVVDAWPEARKEMVKSKLELFPIRVGVLEGVEWEGVEGEEDR